MANSSYHYHLVILTDVPIEPFGTPDKKKMLEKYAKEVEHICKAAETTIKTVGTHSTNFANGDSVGWFECAGLCMEIEVEHHG